MTGVNSAEWSVFAPRVGDADHVAADAAPTPVATSSAPAADVREDGADHGTTFRTPPPGWAVHPGGLTGHTEDPVTAEPHSTPANVVPEPPSAHPEDTSTAPVAQEAPRPPKRSVKQVLVDWYGNPMNAFYRAQPSIYERGQYARKAPWTTKKGALRKLGIAYWNCIGNPGVVTGYLYAEAHSRPAHWVSAFVLGGSWHLTMRSFGWDLSWGWVLTLLVYHVAVAKAAHRVGLQPPDAFGRNSEPVPPD